MRRKSGGPGVSFFAFQDIITAVVGIFILITLIMILELLEKVEAASRTPAGDAAAIMRVIDQTRADADAIEAELQQMRQRQQKENQAIAMSSTVTEEVLLERIEKQQSRNEQLTSQLAAVERQIEDAESRYQSARLQAEAAMRKIEAENRQVQSTLADFKARTQRLAGNDSPLYNDRLRDGRALVIVRLGEHPSRSARLSMREGDREVNRAFVDVEDLIRAIKQRDAQKSHYLVLVAPGGAEDFQTLREYFDSTQGSSLFGSRNLSTSIRYGFDVIGSDADIQLLFELDQG
ncbi:hypothetical protein [Aporhodopirellula aestuarii]|uniref:Uncharacterized protein n=1 Tax=Aporhodopirellula aestuarii TaxID=2950107 RepID=A0ABT0U4N2_9BACT|nr:hypothetical protein [Aporhodopirellula aestuarii]MCM2371864.1 hypothetical protein [Aporhodopirellula aestuarii]